MIRMKLIAIAFAALGSSGFAIAGDDHGGPVTPRPYTTGATLTKAVQASITGSSLAVVPASHLSNLEALQAFEQAVLDFLAHAAKA